MVKLERSLRQVAIHERKQDTRRKIQLGGLIVKAGLADEPPAVILGALLDLAKALAAPDGDATRERLKLEGDKAFAGDGDA
jgi:hypothetical protein